MTPSAGADRREPRVLIVLMPWAPPMFPGLGPALVRSVLERDGIACDIVYGNLWFSRILDADPFFETQLSKLAFSELSFTPFYFDMPAAEAARHLLRYTGAVPNSHADDVAHYERLIAQCGQLLDEMERGIDWAAYDVVGFSVMMQQTVPSLALARRIKQRNPHISILFGGPNCSAPMGEELVRSFPEIDFVLEGEVDDAITPLIRQIRARGGAPAPAAVQRLGSSRDALLVPHGVYDVPGLYYRDELGQVCRTTPAVPCRDLDRVPVPDYAPFFEQMRAHGLTHIQPYLQIETSRGCWWGEKHHCSFCGIDDNLMEFRSKSEEKVLDEILQLSRRHRYLEFFPVDSIINHRFYRTLLPRLGELRDREGFDFSFFFESKSNLRREQVQVFRHAGVKSVQPGIEAFSDHILQLMDKGTTGARQVQCLKFLAECDIVANWNLIYRNPNETADDYRETLAMLPFLHHLPPLHEEGVVPMLLSRFSPYHNDPARYGITNVRPREFYRHVFPREGIDLDRLAFYFDYDHPDHGNEELRALHYQLYDAVKEWQRVYKPDALVQTRGPGFVRIADRRDGESIVTLRGIEAELFRYCDELRAESNVLDEFRGRIEEQEIRAFLYDMVARRFIYRSPSGQLIAVPLLRESRERHNVITTEEMHAVAPQRLPIAPRPMVAESATVKPGTSDAIDAQWLRAEGVSVDDVLALSARHGVVEWWLGEIDFAENDPSPLLRELARLRRDDAQGWALACGVRATITREQVALLRAAGAVRATLAAEAPLGLPLDEANLRQVAAAKLLFEAGIDVQWSLLADLDGESPRDYDTVAEWIPSLLHIAPPAGLVSFGHPDPQSAEGRARLSEQVEWWRREHVPWSLTYGRGPEFVSIFDRRAGELDWRFVELAGPQADAFLACSDGRNFDELASNVPPSAHAALRRLLDTLVAQRVACRTTRDAYLVMPLRRKMEEKWASGDYS